MRPDAIPAGLDDAIERLRLVRSAKAAGMTWAQIGARLGVPGEMAKRGAKRLERDTRCRFLLAAQAAPAPESPAPKSAVEDATP